MPTTSQGIYYPDSTTSVAPLHTAFSTMASSIDNILAGDVQIHKVDNTTQRNALVSQFPPSAANPLFVWRADAPNGRELEYTKNGTTWHYVNTSEDEVSTSGSLASGYSGGWTATRYGKLVILTWSCTTNFNANVAAVPLFTLPSGWRPANDVGASVAGVSLYPWTGAVRTSGQVQVRNNHSAAQSTMFGAAVYRLP